MQFTKSIFMPLTAAAFLSVLLPAAQAIPITLNFTSSYGATGTLTLGNPITDSQTPLSGSFTIDGVTFDLSTGSWNWEGGSPIPDSLNDSVSSSSYSLVLNAQSPLGGEIFQQYSFRDNGTLVHGGGGFWSVAAASTPDTANTALLTCLSLAALGVMSRKLKPVSS
jgi:hypothetical protein